MQVDYAELCAKMTERMATMERELVQKLAAQQERYEGIIDRLATQARAAAKLAPSTRVLEAEHSEPAPEPSRRPSWRPRPTRASHFAEGASEPMRDHDALLGETFETLLAVLDELTRVHANNRERETEMRASVGPPRCGRRNAEHARGRGRGDGRG